MSTVTRVRQRKKASAARRRLMKSMTSSMTRLSKRTSLQVNKRVKKSYTAKSKPPPGAGDWLSGRAYGFGGSRRYYLFRPEGVSASERLPLLVMLHGCSQNASTFACSTRMNAIAVKARALVLYPEQDLRFNPQGCWNWYDTKNGKADAESATLMTAINQVSMLYPVDRSAVAIAGFSAGASMAALLATRYPERFCAVAMHSGVPPGSAKSAASAVSAMRGAIGGMQRLKSVSGPRSWPPLLVVHGNKDRVVAFKNAENAATMWAKALGAREGKARKVQRGKRHTSTITDFRMGARTVVSLNAIEELGHSWSGGDSRERFSDADGPDISRMIWRFVEKQTQTARE